MLNDLDEFFRELRRCPTGLHKPFSLCFLKWNGVHLVERDNVFNGFVDLNFELIVGKILDDWFDWCLPLRGELYCRKQVGR